MGIRCKEFREGEKQGGRGKGEREKEIFKRQEDETLKKTEQEQVGGNRKSAKSQKPSA